MTLRKCPACKNMVDAENETCPVCGCNPIARRIRSVVMWCAVVAMAWVLLHRHVHWSILHAAH